MQLRWVAAIALWTILSAPVFGPPRSSNFPGPRAPAGPPTQPTAAKVTAATPITDAGER